MHMGFSSVEILFLLGTILYGLVLLVGAQSAQNVSRRGSAAAFPAVFAFGDSIVDTGNNNYLPTIAKCNFPPYGRDFDGHEATGRFSNGKVPSDFLASKLGIKEHLPPYLNPNLSDKDLLTGVCFASGSSGYDRLTADVMLVLSIQDQLELFKGYKEKLQKVTDLLTATKIITESLYVVCTGNNDLMNTYSLRMGMGEYDIGTYISFLVSSASSSIEELYNLGARNLLVVGLPPLGCVPSQRTIHGGIQRDCAPLYNQAAQDYNSKLSTELQNLRQKLEGTKIIYGNIFQKLISIIQHPSNYGFVVSDKGCCGTGEFELSILCNNKTNTCVDDSKYIFWDSVHPTEKTYEIIVDKLIQEDLSIFL